MNKAKLYPFKVLDCTIRDGGYCNNWEFDKKMVKELYRNVSKAGVDFIELGFRNKQDGQKRGIWYHTPEEVLNEECGNISGAAIALMLDFTRGDYDSIPNAKDSLIKMYRLACHKNSVLDTLKACEDIHKKGYISSVQLMGVVSYNDKEIKDIIKPLKDSCADYVYFADTYGSMYPDDVVRFIDMFHKTGKKVGFHAHNGLQLAFANSLEAIKHGVDIVDGTVFGMGRGAGNLPLETFITYLEKTQKKTKYNAIPVLDLIDRYFITMCKETPWGYCLPYMLSGIFEVHPSYAKRIVDYHEYNMDDMVKVLEVIKEANPVGYKEDLLNDIINSGFVATKNQAEELAHDEQELAQLKKDFNVGYINRHEGKDFLVLANGPSLKENRTEIEEFIAKYKPVVMGANFLGGLFVPDYHAFSNKKRFINYIDDVNDKSSLLLSSSFEKDFIGEHTGRDYETLVHLNRVANRFDIIDGIINSNCRTVSILLVAAAIVMGARRIFIAGMDGYQSRDNVHFYKESEEAENFKLLMEKHTWNEQLLNSINNYLGSLHKEGVSIITPTSHKFFYSSIENWLSQDVRA